MASPAEDFAQFLADEIAELTLGTNLFYGPLGEGQNIPDDAVFVRSLGGPEPERRVNVAVEVRRVLVSTVVRDKSLTSAISLARKIVNATNGRKAPTGYLSADVIQSEPTDAGKDDGSRFRQIVGHRLMFEESTPS